MISFFVPGLPRTKGSTKSFRSASNGRIVTKNDNPREKGWASSIGWVARHAMGSRAPLEVPVRLEITFFMQRPGKPKFKNLPGVKPDLDKMLRSVKDALTGVVYRDDGLVTTVQLRKRYAGVGRELSAFSEMPGVRVRVEIEEDP